MSTATKLLRRALNSLNNLEDQLKDLGYGWLGGPQLREEIETFLAAEPEAEPVRNNAFDDEICPVCGYYCNGKGGFGCIDKPVLTGLRKTPRPEPARKPMTDEEIDAGFRYGDVGYMNGFFEGIRFAEKHHGIGGDDA